MIIRIFQSGYFVKIIILIAVAVALWVPAFLQPNEIHSAGGSGIMYDVLINSTFVSQRIIVALAFVMLMVQAVVFNAVLVDNPFYSKSAFLPAFIYVILMSHHPGYLTLHPLLVANFFLIFSLKNLFNTYEKTEAFREAFNASFWVSTASLFYFPAIFFTISIWATFIIFRLNTWREWIISVIGICVPYMILMIAYFLTDRFEILIAFLQGRQNWVQPVFDLKLHDYIFWPAFALLLLVSYLKFTAGRFEKIIQIRKSFSVLNILLIISGLSFILSGLNTQLHAFVVFPAASAIIAFYFIEAEKKWHSEILFALVLISVVVVKIIGL